MSWEAHMSPIFRKTALRCTTSAMRFEKRASRVIIRTLVVAKIYTHGLQSSRGSRHNSLTLTYHARVRVLFILDHDFDFRERVSEIRDVQINAKFMIAIFASGRDDARARHISRGSQNVFERPVAVKADRHSNFLFRFQFSILRYPTQYARTYRMKRDLDFPTTIPPSQPPILASQ